MHIRMVALAFGTALLLSACAEGPAVVPYSKAEPAPPAMRAMYLSVIRGLTAQGKAEAALAFLDDYDLKYPGDPEAREARGDALLRVKRPADAAKVFRALDKDGYHAAANFGLGQVSALRNDWRTAARLFAVAARVAPTNVRYLNNEGYALLKIGKPGVAYRVLARTVELAPKDMTARNNFVLAAMRSGHRAEAARVLGTLGREDRERLVAFVTRWSP